MATPINCPTVRQDIELAEAEVVVALADAVDEAVGDDDDELELKTATHRKAKAMR